MPRNSEVVHRRLQQASLELFLERGYDQATTAEIAARAGVTQRTFFRHFADKRDTLFGQEVKLETILVNAVAHAPPHLTPVQIILVALQAMEAIFEEQRAFIEPRSAIIAATPALNERELTKTAALTGILASALEQRGIAKELATLAAQASMAAFNHAMTAWVADSSVGLNTHLDRAFVQLARLFTKTLPELQETEVRSRANRGLKSD
jgi:AcrR family transcriptional regulator